MTTTKTSNQKCFDLIQNKIAFTGSNLYGYVIAPNCNQFAPSTGRLNSVLVQQLESEKPDYIIYSYGTPIAWHGTYGWNIPAVKYSVTTSKHQNYVRRAIS